MKSEDHPGWPVAHGSDVYREPDTGNRVEVRRGEKGALDEVCSDGFFHLEQLDYNHWWLSISGFHVNLYARGTITCEVEPNLTEPVSPSDVERWANESHEEIQTRLKARFTPAETLTPD